MQIGGWIMMSVSLLFVLSLVTFTVTSVLRLPAKEVDDEMHGFSDIDTGDIADAD